MSPEELAAYRDAPRGAMGPYIHIDENDVLKSYLAHIPRLGV